MALGPDGEAGAPGHRDKARLGMGLRKAEQAMLRAKTAALKPVGLTLGQYVALAELDERPGLTAATLARACLVSPQAMMVLLRALEEQGLVRREPHPRHPNVLELRVTPAGAEALQAGRQLVAPIERRVLAAFSDAEIGTLQALLARFAQAFDEA
jgi:DNA-binding MarR family transcriptional regulator